jgi:hypothetical protein
VAFDSKAMTGGGKIPLHHVSAEKCGSLQYGQSFRS